MNAASWIVTLPLVSGILNGLFGKIWGRAFSSLVACSIMSVSAGLGANFFYYSGINRRQNSHDLFKWFDLGDIEISFSVYIDQIVGVMFLAVTLVSAIVHIYSVEYMRKDQNIHKFLSYLSFFTFFMLLLLCSNNFLQIFIGWEGVGLCSYLLIGYEYERVSACAAAVKAFLVNRVADFSFILGIMAIVFYAESANFTEVFKKTEELKSTYLELFGFNLNLSEIICFLIFIGCAGKSAQLFFHVWLPDAMEGPTPVSALIHAATMVTAGVFLIVRCAPLFETAPYVSSLIAIIGAGTCIFAATVAVAQRDIKKIIAYSTCSQLGYMFLACGVQAYSAALFHLITHAFFKALLFLSAGSVIHACKEQDIFKLGGLRKKMPITYFNFWIGSLAIIGIFPLAGFYSKDMILEKVLESPGSLGDILFWIGISAACFTSIYSFKIIIKTFHGKTNMDPASFSKVREVSNIMNLPLSILVTGSVFAGIVGHNIIKDSQLPGEEVAETISSFALRVTEALPTVAGILGALIALSFFWQKRGDGIVSKFSLIYKLWLNKYYFDEIYRFLIISPIKFLARFLGTADQNLIDSAIAGEPSKILSSFAKSLRKLQSGYLFDYLIFTSCALTLGVTFALFRLYGI